VEKFYALQKMPELPSWKPRTLRASESPLKHFGRIEGKKIDNRQKTAQGASQGLSEAKGADPESENES